MIHNNVEQDTNRLSKVTEEDLFGHAQHVQLGSDPAGHPAVDCHDQRLGVHAVQDPGIAVPGLAHSHAPSTSSGIISEKESKVKVTAVSTGQNHSMKGNARTTSSQMRLDMEKEDKLSNYQRKKIVRATLHLLMWRKFLTRQRQLLLYLVVADNRLEAHSAITRMTEPMPSASITPTGVSH